MDIRGRHLALAFAAIAVVAVMLRPELLSYLFMLVFLGIVPGSDIVLPAWATLGAFIIALAFAIRWLFDAPVYRPVATSQDIARRADARRRVIRKTTHHQSRRSPKTRRQTSKA